MTPSTFSQPMDNVQLQVQTGNEVVAKAAFDVKGGDALIGVSASAWASTVPTPISISVWLDGQPTGAELGVYATTATMHLALGHTWVWCHGLTPGQHTLTLVSGAQTVTDQNDYACATVWEMGDGCTVRFTDDLPSPETTGGTLAKAVFEVTGAQGAQVVLSASCSGWITGTPAQMMGASIVYDGAPTETCFVFANNANQDLALVPTDFVTTPVRRGEHTVALNAFNYVSTAPSDITHISAVEFTNPAEAPVLHAHQNVTAQAQHGDGGTIVETQFYSNGNPLLVRACASAWTQATNVPLQMGIQIDGTSRGFLNVFANPSTTHMSMVTNDLVVTGVKAGNHSVSLIGELNTITDQNDRVALLVLEQQAS